MQKACHTFLITGATKGIGLATTQNLIRQGHQVIGIARHEVASFPGKLFLTDLADANATESIFKKINQEFQVDGIVNNVGISSPESLAEIKLSSLQSILDLNLRPALQAMQIFTPYMITKKWGRIVNIASRAVLGIKNRSSYAAAKSALVSFTRVWALELATTGITINAISPGPTETELFRQKRPPGSAAEKETLASVPMERFAQPEEIAAAIVFFLSDEASFITGQNLFVDGGGSIGCLST